MSAPLSPATGDTVTIREAEYEDLKADALKLAALEAAGVDNWGGYDHAMEIRREMEAG